MLFVFKYYKMILIAVALIVFAIVLGQVKRTAYNRGYADAYMKHTQILIKHAQEAAKKAKKNADNAYTQSKTYQDEKADREQKERVRYVEVQKIVKQPVYRNICLDDGGLQLVNTSADDK